MKHVN